MVFFTSILIVSILYYLQADGLIYVTIIAVVAELMNMFLTQTLSKSVEKKLNTKWGKLVEGYKSQLAKKNKTIKELEKIQDESVRKIYMANKKISEYEERLGIPPENNAVAEKKAVPVKNSDPQKPSDKPEEFVDLPCGSGGKKISSGVKRRV